MTPIKCNCSEFFQPNMPPGRLSPVANCGKHGELTLNALCSYLLTPSISSFISSFGYIPGIFFYYKNATKELLSAKTMFCFVVLSSSHGHPSLPSSQGPKDYLVILSLLRHRQTLQRFAENMNNSRPNMNKRNQVKRTNP